MLRRVQLHDRVTTALALTLALAWFYLGPGPGTSRTCLDLSGLVRSSLNLSGPLWTCLDLSGVVRAA